MEPQEAAGKPCCSRSLQNGSPREDEARRAPLRPAQSCEENDDEEPGACADGRRSDADRNNLEGRPCPKYRSCRERILERERELESTPTAALAPGSSRAPDSDEERTRRGRKRAACVRAGRSNLEADSSSDTGNDDYSLGSEDGCIYTYRGGEHLADLPSSFFSLDMGLPPDNHLPPRPPYAPPLAQEERPPSSPEMDFLEMDFDPGPSCEVDSGEETSPEDEPDLLSPRVSPVIEVAAVRGITPEANIVVPLPCEPDPSEGCARTLGLHQQRRPSPEPQATTSAESCQPSTSYAHTTSPQIYAQGENNVQLCPGPLITHVNARGERLLVRRTFTRWPPRPPVTHHTTSGDLVCECHSEVAENSAVWSSRNCSNCYNGLPRGGGGGAGEAQAVDKVNLSSALYHCTMAKKLIVEKPDEDFMIVPDTSNLEQQCEREECSAPEAGVSEVGRCMIWSEREACERQVTQIGTSACGATAVVNAFIALGIPINTDMINESVGTRLRANSAPIPRYLVSRSMAGCTAAGLVAGLQHASGGRVTARFFPTHPERVLSLSHWLADWISLGAVPVATLNLQAGCEGSGAAAEVPDAWHHQMIFGVSPRGVFLTNPVECVREAQLWPQLSSESVLLVRARDVVSRLTPRTDLRPLTLVPDPRWAASNVLGQVVNVIREYSQYNHCSSSVRHVRVPCAYRAGITVAALTGSEAHKRLMRAPPLPPCAPSAGAPAAPT